MFRQIHQAIEEMRAAHQQAVRDWKQDNFDGCVDRLLEVADDCDKLAAEIRNGVANARVTNSVEG